MLWRKVNASLMSKLACHYPSPCITWQTTGVLACRLTCVVDRSIVQVVAFFILTCTWGMTNLNFILEALHTQVFCFVSFLFLFISEQVLLHIKMWGVWKDETWKHTFLLSFMFVFYLKKKLRVFLTDYSVSHSVHLKKMFVSFIFHDTCFKMCFIFRIMF